MIKMNCKTNNIIVLIIFFVVMSFASASSVCAQLLSNFYATSLNDAFEQTGILSEMNLKKGNRGLLCKTDTFYEIKNEETYLGVMTTNFSYDNGYLSKRECILNLYKVSSDDLEMTEKYTSYLIYNYEGPSDTSIDKCIATDIKETTSRHNSYKSITISKLHLDGKGNIDSAFIMRHLHDQMPLTDLFNNDGFVLKIKKTKINDKFINAKNWYSIYGKDEIPLGSFLRWQSPFLFRSLAKAKFFERNIGFTDSKEPLLQKRDFYFPVNRLSGMTYWSNDKMDFISLEGTTGFLFYINKRTGAYKSVYERVSHDYFKLKYSKFYYYKDSIKIQRFRFFSYDENPEIAKKQRSLFYQVFSSVNIPGSVQLDIKQKNLFGSMYSKMNLSKEIQLNKELEEALKPYISSEETIVFEKDGKIKEYRRINLENGKNPTLGMNVIFCYEGKLLTYFIIESEKYKHYATLVYDK